MSGREDVTFVSDGVRCAAWLYRPHGANGQVPVIVMAHGLGGVREMRLDAFAERFVAAGYACLVFDYRHFGASEGEPRQLLSIRHQRHDWTAAVAFARTLPGLDPDRVILWGTSFSGGHVLAVASRDPRIAAVVSQCPFTDGIASSLAVPPLTSLRLTLIALLDLVGSWFGRRPRYVPLAGRPGDVALMTAPDVMDGFTRLLPDGPAPREDAAARIAMGIAFDRPGRRARSVQAPTYVVVCTHDTVAPPGATRRHAARLPRGEVVERDTGHFDIYVGEEFERTVADELDFLARHVPTR